MISKSDRKIEISLVSGVLSTNNPTMKYKKSGTRKKNKLLLVKILTLKKYKKETTIYRENKVIYGFILKKDTSNDCNNNGLTPKSRLIFKGLLSFCTSKPAKKLGKKNKIL